MEKLSLLGLSLSVLCLLNTEFVGKSNAQLVNCLKSDEEALTDFRYGLEDPENRLSSWQRGSDCCPWEGIVCDEKTGAVISIDLPGRYGFWNLSGEIRPSLLKLKSLRHLDLSFNTFIGITIPQFFGSLEKLQYLNLSNSGFSGKVPPNLGNLSSLQYLDFEDLSLVVDSLEWIAGLVSLKYLAMDGVDLSMVGIGCLTGHIPFITSVNFTSLAVLDLSFNNLKSVIPDWLVNMSSLEHVRISYSGLHGRIPLGFSELPNLVSLDLSGNENLTASCFQLFKGRWEKIQVLNLASNKLHGKLPSSLGNLTSLVHLDLFSNNIEGGIPNSIGKLCNLSFFRLSGNNLTGTLPEFLEGGGTCFSTFPLPNLKFLHLSNNNLVGTIPEWVGQVKNLVELDLDYNFLEGPIPPSIGSLQNLTNLGLAGNEVTGSLPEELGQLSKLEVLDVSSNQLTGIVSEAHFSKLSKLKILHLSSNSLTLNVSSHWNPPFQVRNLDMGSCTLGPSFPSWLQSQKEIMYLDVSNASISGFIPSWFWDISSNLSLLSVSSNNLHGHLPNPFPIAPFADVDLSSNLFEGEIPLTSSGIELLDLSHNHFSGTIPPNIAESMPYLIFWSLSSNQLSGEVPPSLGEISSLQVIDLSRNNLSGQIPASLGKCSYLKALDLGGNSLSGGIPHTLGNLKQLKSLHLSDNHFSGEFPSSFQNMTSLETLDLANNRFSGKIPAWVWYIFPYLRILSLRSNAFWGDISSDVSNLKSLQVLDLANNSLSGIVPPSIAYLEAMSQESYINRYLLYGSYRGVYYEEILVVTVKGQLQKYTKTLSLVTSIDLSGNNLSGNLPEDITKLTGLVVLNLSMNHIYGEVPQRISKMQQLSSLDLSSNKLSGTIPSTMSSLTFLGYLNLSNNDLSGPIPYQGHMTTFDALSFDGNPNLCGPPLSIPCNVNGSSPGDDNSTEHDGGDDEFIDSWFYLSLGLGFAVGLVVPYLILACKRSWSEAYFGFVEDMVERVSMFAHRTCARKKKKRPHARR